MKILLVVLALLFFASGPALAKHANKHHQKKEQIHPCKKAKRPCTMKDYAAAIRRIESSNRYDIRTNAGKGRWALGAYQIMDFNLKKWSKEALGREVSEEEFLKNPEIQDKIFEFKFRQYIQKYGSPETAARVWLAGPKNYKSKKHDIFGTTPDKYALRFLGALRRILGIFGVRDSLS